MSTDQKQAETELFDTVASDELDGGTDSASTSDATDESSAEAEESQITSNAEREKQIRAHIRKIEDGKQTLEELAEKQPWIADEIQKRQQKEKKEQVDPVDLDRLVEQKLEAKLKAEQEKREFESFRKRLNEIPTTRDQRASIKEEFEDLLQNGVPEHVALQKAAKIAGVDVDSFNPRRASMHVPRVGGTPRPVTSIEEKIINQRNLSQDEIRSMAKARSRKFASLPKKK